MSKYVDAVKRARPERLYVFDLTQTDLGGGTVTNDGYTGGDLTVEEDAGFAEIDTTEAIIEGVTYAVHPNVIHDRSVNNADQYFSSFLASGGASALVGPNAKNKWSVEIVFKPGKYNRGRNNTFAPLLAFEQTNVTGLALDFDFTNVYEPTFQFVYTEDFDESLNAEVLRTASYSVDEVHHVVLSKTNKYYALQVNGKFAISGNVDNTYSSTALTSTDFRVGGWSSLYHSDCVLQTFATFDRFVSSEEIKDRYNAISLPSWYTLTAGALDPSVNVEFIADNGTGAFEPIVANLSSGANADDLYEDENGYLKIQPSELAAPVTKEKILKFDLSNYDVGPSVFLDIVSVTGANSSLTVEYSFDNASYSTFNEGLDTIPELDAVWGGVV